MTQQKRRGKFHVGSLRRSSTTLVFASWPTVLHYPTHHSAWSTLVLYSYGKKLGKFKYDFWGTMAVATLCGTW